MKPCDFFFLNMIIRKGDSITIPKVLLRNFLGSLEIINE